MAEQACNVLFLCAGNSARSIMAEALINHLGMGRFRGWSAGTSPRGRVHPATLRLLTSRGLPTEGLRSKSWDEFVRPGAPRMDFVFTVCASQFEICPVWPGAPITANWGVIDPATGAGLSIEAEDDAFLVAFHILELRIEAFAALPLAELDRLTLHRKVGRIGELDHGAARSQALE